MSKKDIYDWRYENSINWSKEYIDVEGIVDFSYNAWRTNATLANYPDTILHANQMNMNSGLDVKLQYDYLFQSIKKKKRFFKRIGKTFNNSDFLAIQAFYKYNNKRTAEALKILSREQIDIIIKSQEKGE
jgi:hypothetical protein